MPKPKTITELQHQLASNESQLHKLKTRHATLRSRISKAERSAYDRLCYVYGKLVLDCGLRNVPLCELQKAFKTLAAQWPPRE